MDDARPPLFTRQARQARRALEDPRSACRAGRQTGQPGFLAAEIQLPYEDDERLLVWSSWASREHYERWLAGPAGQGMLREIRTLLAEEPVWRVYQVVDTIH